MDRNSIVGIVLILGILIGFSIYNRPSEEEIARKKFVRDSITQVEKQQQLEQIERNQYQEQKLASQEMQAGPNTASDSLLELEYGVFVEGSKGKKSFIHLKNDKIDVTLSNLGAKIYSVGLNGYQTYDSLPLHLFDGDSTVFGFGLSSIGKSTNELFFTPTTEQAEFDATNTAQTVSYRLSANENSYIEFTYTLEPDSYQLKYDVNIVGLDYQIREKYLSFEWNMYSPQQEKGKKWESDNTTIHYQYFEDEDDYLTPTSDEQSEILDGRVKWIAYKQQFFSAAFIADEYFLKGSQVKYTSLPLSNKHTKRFESLIDVELDRDNEVGFKFYFGPNHYPTLKAQGENLHKLLPLGWGIFGWVNKFIVIPIFNWLSSFLTNYGLIILLLTIIIKAMLFPLTFKSYISTARMRVLKPEIDQINEKYTGKDQMMKRQQETMGLYKKVGVNPMGGCLPMVVQMPILFAMFKFFPTSIELRQESFLWAKDLSTYDSIFNLPFEIPFYGDHVSLFTLLMAISMIATTQLNSNQMTQAPGQPNMKVIMWMMPVMMVVWFNSYSSGLSYYYFIANMITLGQTYLIRAFINDDAILEKLKQNKKKAPKAKSKFQQRMEKMAKDRGLK